MPIFRGLTALGDRNTSPHLLRSESWKNLKFIGLLRCYGFRAGRRQIALKGIVELCALIALRGAGADPNRLRPDAEGRK